LVTSHASKNNQKRKLATKADVVLACGFVERVADVFQEDNITFQFIMK
jgi:hypothetical protein